MTRNNTSDWKCEHCGCTDVRPCVAAGFSETCSWVRENKCSACYDEYGRPRFGDKPEVRRAPRGRYSNY